MRTPHTHDLWIGGTRRSTSWARWHAKLVVKTCKGLILAPFAVLPLYSPISIPPLKGCPGTALVIFFLSVGLGLVELDFCCSKTVSKRMRESAFYELLHLLLRMAEFVSRTLIIVHRIEWKPSPFQPPRCFGSWLPSKRSGGGALVKEEEVVFLEVVPLLCDERAAHLLRCPMASDCR